MTEPLWTEDTDWAGNTTLRTNGHGGGIIYMLGSQWSVCSFAHEVSEGGLGSECAAKARFLEIVGSGSDA